MPMLAGPGSIASIMLLTARTHGPTEMAVVLVALAAVMVLAFAAMVAARPIIRLLGAQIEAVVTRLLGVLLAALAAQFVIDGIKGQLF
jgi:multiple antibiotic resistance protein